MSQEFNQFETTTNVTGLDLSSLMLPGHLPADQEGKVMRPQLLYKQAFNFKVWMSYQHHYNFFKLLDKGDTEYVDAPIWEENLLQYINDDTQNRQKNFTFPFENITDIGNYYSQMLSLNLSMHLHF